MKQIYVFDVTETRRRKIALVAASAEDAETRLKFAFETNSDAIMAESDGEGDFELLRENSYNTPTARLNELCNGHCIDGEGNLSDFYRLEDEVFSQNKLIITPYKNGAALPASELYLRSESFIYDGCHKIYIIEGGEGTLYNENGWNDASRPLSELAEVYRNSCPLRFIERMSNFEDIVPQCCDRVEFSYEGVVTVVDFPQDREV
jgi:hypothetical protein